MYKPFMTLIKRSPPVRCPRGKWFPTIPMNAEHIPPVIADEVLDAVTRDRNKAAFSIDGIPNKALKLALRIMRNMSAQVFTDCLKEKSLPVEGAL